MPQIKLTDTCGFCNLAHHPADMFGRSSESCAGMIDGHLRNMEDSRFIHAGR